MGLDEMSWIHWKEHVIQVEKLPKVKSVKAIPMPTSTNMIISAYHNSLMGYYE